MPKDNEVDEKVMRPTDELAKTVARYNINYVGMPQGVHYSTEGDWVKYSAHAATVAELRAKADAAERRVGELEADARRYRYLREKRDVLLCTGFFGNCCVNKTVADVDAAIDTLTGADPT